MASSKTITTKKCSAYEHIIELREKCMQVKKVVMNIDATEGPFTTEQVEKATEIETLQELGEDLKTKPLSENIKTLKKLCGEIETIFGQMKFKDKGYVFYVLDLSPSQATSSFIEALKNKINVRLMKQAHDIKDIDKHSRVIVMCSLTSRFECNLEIMKEINPEYHNKIVLVLLHCVHKKNLPSDSRIPEVKKIYQDLNEVVEMAFHKKIYRCSMNKKALKVLGKYQYLS